MTAWSENRLKRTPGTYATSKSLTWTSPCLLCIIIGNFPKHCTRSDLMSLTTNVLLSGGGGLHSTMPTGLPVT